MFSVLIILSVLYKAKDFVITIHIVINMLSKHVDGEKVVKHNASSSRKHPTLHSPAYGARFYSEPIPKFKLPKDTMPANVAYQLVHDEMQLDGNCVQNMATFIASWMEPEARTLINETIGKNMADCDEYPQSQEIHQRCVSMLADLYHAPDVEHHSAYGTATIGSSEAFMLAAMAMKFKWRDERKAKGLPHDKPNIVYGNNAQVALHKFSLYFDVEERLVPVTKETDYVLSVEGALKLVDENTIGVVAILGSTFTGHFEPVKELNKALTGLNKKNGWNVGIHIDAASGGFIAPFIFPDLEWDFRLPLVRSINVSGHKYGLVYPGVGWVIWRSKEFLPQELVFHINYLGGDYPTFTLNFSRSSSPIIAQYYNFLRLGFKGYKGIVETCAANAKFLANCLKESGYFDIISNPETGLPLVAFTIKDKKCGITEHDIMNTLRQKGWIVPAYPLTANVSDMYVLRVVVREGHSEDLLEHLVLDTIWAYETVEEKIKEAQEKGDGKKGKKRGRTDEEKEEEKHEVQLEKRRHIKHGTC
eukprot:Phypoly_transcript_06648.p1 GENE.Phypoly_transcript_06648~~Phypoly_transcript_06648.p1  ORF type:complete len:532 (+),score=84.44 Phypoly_transcript_06648:41-1636(+)